MFEILKNILVHLPHHSDHGDAPARKSPFDDKVADVALDAVKSRRSSSSTWWW